MQEDLEGFLPVLLLFCMFFITRIRASKLRAIFRAHAVDPRRSFLLSFLLAAYFILFYFFYIKHSLRRFVKREIYLKKTEEKKKIAVKERNPKKIIRKENARRIACQKYSTSSFFLKYIHTRTNRADFRHNSMFRLSIPLLPKNCNRYLTLTSTYPAFPVAPWSFQIPFNLLQVSFLCFFVRSLAFSNNQPRVETPTFSWLFLCSI